MLERNKDVVRRLIAEVLNAGRLDVVDELYAPTLAPRAKRWIAPFRASFPDVHMEVVELIAEEDKVVGRFTCSGTHLGAWRGHAPTGRRFEAIAEVSSSGSATAGSSTPGGSRTPSGAWSNSGCSAPRTPEARAACAGHPAPAAPSCAYRSVASRAGARRGTVASVIQVRAGA